ncbi:MAG: response regulator [Gammaproteobacteria bacterium]|nr:MAG: response regulator [Gammaproteobacteria bacterium]
MSDNKDKYHIHIVDDQATNRIVLKKMLQGEFEVSQSENGRDCINFVIDNQPDLILLDIMMPGMSGFKTCNELKNSEYLFDIPIIFITAVDDRSYILEAFRNGGADYIIKPFTESEVKSRVISVLNAIRLKKDKENLLKCNKVILGKIRQLLSDLTVLKQVDCMKSDIAQGSATLLDYLDQARLNVTNGNISDALHAIDDAEMSLQFSDRASQQINEMVKVINQITLIMSDDADNDASDRKSLENSSTDSVLSRKHDQSEVDDLLDSLGI